MEELQLEIVLPQDVSGMTFIPFGLALLRIIALVFIVKRVCVCCVCVRVCVVCLLLLADRFVSQHEQQQT